MRIGSARKRPCADSSGTDSRDGTTAALANTRARRGDFAGGEEAYLQAHEAITRTLGPDHPDMGYLMNNFAVFYYRQGRLPEAEALFGSTAQRAARVHGESEPLALQAAIYQADALLQLNRPADAEPIVRLALDRVVNSASLGPGRRLAKQGSMVHARCLDTLDRPADAAAVRARFQLNDPSTAPSVQPGPR